MNKIINWVKTHKFHTVVFIIAAWLFVNYFNNSMRLMGGSVTSFQGGYDTGGSLSTGYSKGVPARSSTSLYYPEQEIAPQPNVVDRKVVTNSNFSILVKNVSQTVDKILLRTKEVAGYMVNSYTSSSEYGESANVQVRIPSEKIDEFSKYLRTLSVKVVSENINGQDITDQYVDIEGRLKDLETQKARMNEILAKAQTVSEILEVQNGIFRLQDQIDSYKGQLQYMDGTTKTSLVTVYLSTDELSLPYTPQKPWRPEVVFKQAVRSLVGALQKIGSAAIWIAVFTPLILIVVWIVVVINKTLKRRSIPKQ